MSGLQGFGASELQGFGVVVRAAPLRPTTAISPGPVVVARRMPEARARPRPQLLGSGEISQPAGPPPTDSAGRPMPASVKKSIAPRKRTCGRRSSLISPNRGLSTFCCCNAAQPVARKDCFFADTGMSGVVGSLDGLTDLRRKAAFHEPQRSTYPLYICVRTAHASYAMSLQSFVGRGPG